MTPELLNILCDPASGQPLCLHEAVLGEDGNILEGYLAAPSGQRFPIRNGIPRFLPQSSLAQSVTSFGDEWNFFNFTQFKLNWLAHTVKNTFGSAEVFKDKTIVDAGGGSGSQTLWMLEAGAKHLIMLELSHAVDDVVQKNLKSSGYRNYDVIQCSIDSPPLRAGSIDGIVYCHNVIQHTPSVEKTAAALFNLVAPGGEFVFNCYPMNDQGVVRWVRFHMVYEPVRWVLSKMPFGAILFYSRLMGVLREIPLLGVFFEKAGLCVQGDVTQPPNEGFWSRLRRRFRATTLNTFDAFGSHSFQHHKSDAEMRALIRQLQPNPEKILNVDRYFARPTPIGCALRVFR